jgi:hypothetical protein
MARMTPPFLRKSPIAGALAEAGRPQALAGADAPGEGPKPARRARLWDLKDKFHCPLIGTCLSMDELARFARRHAFAGDLRDEYLLHVEAVGCAGNRNPVSEDLHKHFEQKYAGYIARFERVKSADELLAFWKAHFENGEVAGPMWAALTHRAANEETRHAVYADVHMLSHQVGAGLAADAKRLAWLTRRNEELAAALERDRADAAGRDSETRRLGVELKTARAAEAAARAETASLRERLAAFESGAAIVDMGRRLMAMTAANEELRAAADRGRALQAALGEAEARNASLSRERDQLAAERDALERLLLAGEVEPDACDGACDGCGNRIAGRCVLCVGGRHSLVAQYRALAERLGIRLIHHDGGQEESLSRLPELINGADAVLCPTDCVSHAAYYKLKQHCKRTGKPCLLFKGAGVSGFAVALARLSAGQASIATARTTN